MKNRETQENLWENTAQENFQGLELKEDISVDIAIIGAGYTGLSAALEAARLGANVIVLEANSVGFGGSGRNVGLVNAGLWLPPEKVTATLGKEAGTKFNAVLAQAPKTVFDLIDRFAIECEAVQNGTLHCAHSTSGFGQLEERYHQMAALGAPVTLLNAKQAQDRVGSSKVWGALHDARAGTIQPLSYARGLANAAVSRGAKIYENARVGDIEKRGEKWVLTTSQSTPHKSIITAGKILVATNGYHLPVSGLIMPNVTSVNFFQMATDPLPETIAAKILPGREGCWDTGMIMTSFRMDAQNRFIIGGMGRPETLGIHQTWARRAMARLYPDLRNMSLRECWSGKISMTSDHIPKLLEIGRDGFAMFGYSGRGIGPGTIMGTALGSFLVAGNARDLPIEPVNSFKELWPDFKTGFYETGARAVHCIKDRVG